MNTALHYLDIAPLSPPPPAPSWRLDDAGPREAPDQGPDASVGEALLDQLGASLGQLAVSYDSDHEALWCAFKHPVRPCFTPDLLREINRFQRRLARLLRAGSSPGCAMPGALVWHSNFSDVWNLGGDLALFVRLITSGEREKLRAYARRCVETVWRNWTKGHNRIATIALIEGDALGGGFEAALSNDVIIAEQHSKFGLPEILFRMFPGMGAYSFLSRRIGSAAAESMITSGRLYSAEDLATMGIVDLVVDTGQGKAAVREWLSGRRRRVFGSLAMVRRRCQPITYEELIDVSDIWVDAALALTDSDLRKMERLAKAQDRRCAREVSRVAA